ncbi:hypothetical protein P5P81_05265 [Tritonibacter mobilis]|nr:hypothetical protein [Tritonibacter mobilis]
MLAIIAVALLLMFWAGPLAVAMFAQGGEETVSYRQLRAAVPWKYIGFFLGGFTMVFGLISFIEGRMSRRAAVFGLLSVAGLITLFDVPFDNILLPPNGDF